MKLDHYIERVHIIRVQWCCCTVLILYPQQQPVQWKHLALPKGTEKQQQNSIKK